MNSDPVAVAQHAALIQPALLYLVLALAAAVLGLGGLIARFVWCRITEMSHKISEALVLLYALCHAVKPDGVDCDEIGKVICGLEK